MMTSRSWQTWVSSFGIGLLTWGLVPSTSRAQDELPGFIIGKVYEVDKEKYRKFIEKHVRRGPTATKIEIDPDEFLIEREDVIVTARQLENNYSYDSDISGDNGDYVITDTPPGVYEFTLRRAEEKYPVRQRLGVKVDLSYVAELCFVIDKEEKVAWMVSAGARRAPEVPPFVPTVCQSALGACLAMLMGDEVLPDGLLLLLAGSAAAATNIGIIATEQDEASSLVRKKK
jgi:hypothetical protein